jgi:hypothetical protein
LSGRPRIKIRNIHGMITLTEDEAHGFRAGHGHNEPTKK